MPLTFVRTIFLGTSVLLSVIFSGCIFGPTEVNPNVEASWVSFVLSGPYLSDPMHSLPPETTVYRFQSTESIPQVGTYYTLDDETSLYVPDGKNGTDQNSVLLTFPGRSAGNFPTYLESVKALFGFSSPEGPWALVLVRDTLDRSINVKHYPAEGGRIDGEFDLRLRLPARDFPCWRAVGSFSVVRGPNESTPY